MTADSTCFVIMPYGVKKDVDGNGIDFDEIYEYVIKVAVELVPGLKCLRCDDIEQPGWIAARMITNIADAAVAIVDTSTLNPNVFYELGVRHALKKAVTVLIRKEGTSSPFNIQGLSSIEYNSSGPKGIEQAKQDIRNAIVSALNDPKNVDSLVYEVLPGLQVQRGAARVPKPLTKMQVFEFPLAQNPDKRLALITGDREYVTLGDIWVNSENTNMQMDRFYGRSTSATIRYLGARKNEAGNVVEDTIEEELRLKMAQTASVEVPPSAVLVTGAGALKEHNHVKWIFHVASVMGEPREGYRPVTNIERCVKNALREASKDEYRAEQVSSVLFPIFGTGPGGGDLRDHAARCFNAAAEFLESNPDGPINLVYFYAWSDIDLEICQSVIQQHPSLVAGARDA